MNRVTSHDGDGAAAGGTYLVPARAASVISSSLSSLRSDLTSAKRWRRSNWRHTLGLILLLGTVFLWTTSNFLQSTIFADNTYSKPFLITYVNSAFFILPLIPLVLRKLYENPSELASLQELIPRKYTGYSRLRTSEDGERETDAFLKPDEEEGAPSATEGTSSTSHARPLDNDDDADDHALGSPIMGGGENKLGLAETVRLSFHFAFLWFAANYFVAACLQYTTVASSTILTSTSSIWTLLIGTLWGVERFTVRKLLGVVASLCGVILVSLVDLTGDNNENRGTFPHKTTGEMAIGNSMAFVSALLYGIYIVVMKKQIDDEGRVNMPLFFGLVGCWNVMLLWPLFFLLHMTGVETFELPPTTRVLVIILINCTSSLLSDFFWAYAMLLTSPLITTVGLSLTIPFSLIGQMILDKHYSAPVYWIGAAIVLCSFIFINHEESKDGELPSGPVFVNRDDIARP